MEIDQAERFWIAAPGQWENDEGPLDWWVVVDEETGTVAACAERRDTALKIRDALRKAVLRKGATFPKLRGQHEPF